MSCYFADMAYREDECWVMTLGSLVVAGADGESSVSLGLRMYVQAAK